MSELKAFDVGLGRYTEDGSPCVVAVDADQNPRLLGDEKVYLKSDADKVIAEKDAEIAELKAQKAQAEDDCAYWKTKAQRERHHKYKRCKEMAERCAEAYNRECVLNPEEMTDKEFYKQQIEFWPRWERRWLELAEKFKPNSTAQ